VDEETGRTINPDPAIVITDEEEKQTPKPQRTSHRNSVKRLFKDYIKSEDLWMSKTLSNLGELLELTNDVIKSSEEVVKQAKTIQDQVINSQNFIKACGGKEEKVTRRLEKL
jgi:hypothetical protein